MELIRDNWSNGDIKKFQKYIKSYENKNKTEWSKKLLRTELPVLAIEYKDIKEIVKGIQKGNYLSFLDFMVWEYYENTAINGFLISSIKDFNTMKKYLDIYSEKCDNWATCDLLKFNIKGKEKEYFDLVLEYVKNEKPFVKRIGMSILFNYVNKEEYINKIFKLLDIFDKEENYYVNMMNSWLLCECYIKQKEKTLKYLENNNLNKFTINKGIQKCRESRRVSEEDKEMLLKYKIK